MAEGLPQHDEDPWERLGGVRVTPPGTLVVLGLLGLVVGWGGRHYSIADWPGPSISWLVVAVFWFVAAVTAGIAYLTRRTVTLARPTLSAQQGMGRLVLGKTICRAAAFALGMSSGVAISQLGVVGENAGDIIVRALLGALGAALGVAAGLLLEHACRVPPAAKGDLP